MGAENQYRCGENVTYRKLYPGNHIIEIQINGKQMATKAFELIED
jgi:hypothetical protein